MPGAAVFILFVGAIAFIAIAVAAIVSAARRRQALEEWAKAKGWTFRPGRDHKFASRYPAFHCLKQGDSNRYAYNIVTGVCAGRHIKTFDYHYATRSRDSKGKRKSSSHHFSGAIVEAKLPLKPLMIRRENFLDKIAAVFGYGDINFESAVFSRRFHVSAPDRRWAYDVLHPRTIDLLLRESRFSIQFDHQQILAWRNSSVMSLHEFNAAIDLLAALLDNLPEYVRKQQRAAAIRG